MILKQYIFYTILLSFCFSTLSYAKEGYWFEDKLKLRDLVVLVRLDDDAKVGCWTNLREVREYAEEKLYRRGVKLVKEFDYNNANNYELVIGVHANRIYADGSGPCGGIIKIDLKKMIWSNERLHYGVMYSGSQKLVFMNKNFNNTVLDVLRTAINSMP